MSGPVAKNAERRSGEVGTSPSATTSSSDPAYNTNPSSGVGTEWHNTTSGEIFICIDATTNENVWQGQTRQPTIGLTRGLFAGGTTDWSTWMNNIDYVSIPTLGNSTDFGDLSTIASKRGKIAGISNGAEDRGVWGGGGYGTNNSNVIDYVTMSTPGNATDFGDLTVSRITMDGCSNGIGDIGIFMAGYANAYNDVMDFINFNNVTNAYDFGNLSNSRGYVGSCSNGINDRGIVGVGGTAGGGNQYNIIEYVTISTKGNATDFGNLSSTRNYVGTTSNDTNDRAVFASGIPNTNVIEYVTISSPGNVTDFGDLSAATQYMSGAACSSGIDERALFLLPDSSNRLDYITISTPGNASDFGDLSTGRYDVGATSQSGQ